MLKKCICSVMFMYAIQLCGQDAAPVTPQRHGFIVGFAIGSGWVHVAENNQSIDKLRLALPNLKFGFMLAPNIALMAYVPTGIHYNQDKPRAFEGFMLAVQYWLSDRVWLLGGAGLTLDFPVIFTDTHGFYVGPGFCLAAGIELIHTQRFGLDVQGRMQIGSATIENNVTRSSRAMDIMLGFTWY